MKKTIGSQPSRKLAAHAAHIPHTIASEKGSIIIVEGTEEVRTVVHLKKSHHNNSNNDNKNKLTLVEYSGPSNMTLMTLYKPNRNTNYTNSSTTLYKTLTPYLFMFPCIAIKH